MADQHGVAGLTMEEIIRKARREVWGPMPGDPDHLEVELTLPEVAALTGREVNALGGLAARGSIPGARREGRFWIVPGSGLILAGLLTPAETAALKAG